MGVWGGKALRESGTIKSYMLCTEEASQSPGNGGRRMVLTSIDKVADDAVDGVDHEVDVDGGRHTVVAESLAHAGPDLQEKRVRQAGCVCVRERERERERCKRGGNMAWDRVRWKLTVRLGT